MLPFASLFTYETHTHNRTSQGSKISLLVSTARVVLVTAVGGGTVYGSVKAGVWSTDGNKSVETLREVKFPPGLLFHHDSQVNSKP